MIEGILTTMDSRLDSLRPILDRLDARPTATIALPKSMIDHLIYRKTVTMYEIVTASPHYQKRMSEQVREQISSSAGEHTDPAQPVAPRWVEKHYWMKSAIARLALPVKITWLWWGVPWANNSEVSIVEL